MPGQNNNVRSTLKLSIFRPPRKTYFSSGPHTKTKSIPIPSLKFGGLSGVMELRTDHWYAGVLLALLTTILKRCSTNDGKIWLLRLAACLLAGCLVNKRGREYLSRQAITRAKCNEGTLVTNHNAATEKRGYNYTRAPSKAVFADTSKIRREPNPCREFGECIEGVALYNPPPHH